MEIVVTNQNGVRELKLNRPEVFNSFNKAMAIALQNELDKCATDNSVRAVIITGEGKAFCAGQDLCALMALAVAVACQDSQSTHCCHSVCVI